MALFYFHATELIFVSLFVWICWLLLQLRKKHKTDVTLLYQKTIINNKITDSCPSLHKYNPPLLWGYNGHLQTAALTRIKPVDPGFETELIKTPDGGTIAVHTLCPEVCNDKTPIVFMVPGIAGSDRMGYIRNMSRVCVQNNWRAAAFSHRGCDTILTSPRLFSYGDPSDMRQALQHIHKKFPDAPVVAIAWSMGANILVNYLGQHQDDGIVRGAVSICQGYSVTRGCEHIASTRFYDMRLTWRLQQVVKKHCKFFQEKTELDIEHILNQKTLHEFDAAFSCKLLNYNSPGHYYSQSGCDKYLPHIGVPLVLINALDDPLIPSRLIPYHSPEDNPNIILAVTNHGGHMAYFEGGVIFPKKEHWMERVSAELVHALLPQ